MDIRVRVSAIFDKGDNFRDFVCFPIHQSSSGNGFTLKGKNLSQGEQILSFQSRHLFRGKKDNFDRVVSLGSVSVHLKGS